MVTHRRLSVLVAAAGLVCAGALSSRAAVLAAEPFDYSANLGASLNGLNGGTGWGGAWTDASGNVTVGATNTSLSYPPGVPLAPTGSRVEVTAEATTAISATRTLGTTIPLGTNGLEFYSSALFRRSALAGESASVNFFNGVNTRWTYGIDAAGQFYVTVDPANAGQRATSPVTDAANPDETFLLVAKIRTNTGPGTPPNDEVFLEIFGPGETVTVPGSDADWDLRTNGNSGVTLNTVRLDFTNIAGQTNQIDELRIGTTFEDVTGVVPEPGALSLVAAAGLAACARRRRPRAR